MKRFMVALILICILLLVAIDVKILLNINSVKTNLNKEVDLLQSQIDDLKKSEKDKNEGIEISSEQPQTEKTNSSTELKEGTYINSDDPEIHFLTLENGKAESGTFETNVGNYKVEGDKLYITYTKGYGPDGDSMEIDITEEIYKIDGDTLVQEEPYQYVYTLKK